MSFRVTAPKGPGERDEERERGGKVLSQRVLLETSCCGYLITDWLEGFNISFLGLEYQWNGLDAI